jgi:hypothetical protein
VSFGLSANGRWMGAFTPTPLRKSPRYPLIGSESLSWCCGEEKNFLPLMGMTEQLVGCVAQDLVTVPTTLSGWFCCLLWVKVVLCRHCSIVRLQLVGIVRFLHLKYVRPVVVVVALSRAYYMEVMCDQLRIFGNYGVLLGLKIDKYCGIEFCSPLGFSTI